MRELTQEEKAIIKVSGTDFTVEKILLEADGNPTDIYAIRRTDNHDVLSACKSRYTIMQNHSIVESVITQRPNFELAQAYSFNGGRKVAYFFKFGECNEPFTSAGEDYDKYFYVLTSHDGSSRLQFGYSNRIHSCSNMFSILPSSCKLKHTSNRSADIENAIQTVLDLDLSWKFHSSQMKNFSIRDTTLRRKICNVLIEKVLGVNYDDAGAKMKHRFAQILQCIDIECRSKGYNLFGIFNGFTYYANHRMNSVSRDNSSDIANRMETIHLGTGKKLMDKAFHVIKEYYERQNTNPVP
jgi:hypothetical protein